MKLGHLALPAVGRNQGTHQTSCLAQLSLGFQTLGLDCWAVAASVIVVILRLLTDIDLTPSVNKFTVKQASL